VSPDLVFLAILYLVLICLRFLFSFTRSSTNTFTGRTRTRSYNGKVRTALGNTPEGQATVWGVCFRMEEASSLFSLFFECSVSDRQGSWTREA
jgi:hypothetical protein